MSILDLTQHDVNNLPTGKVHPDGTEIKARITNVNQDVDKNQVPYIMPFFEDSDDSNVLDFGDYLPLPVSGDSDKDKGKKLRRLKDFSDAFEANLFQTQVDLESMKGKTGWIIVGIGKDKDGNPVNKVKKYVAGK